MNLILESPQSPHGGAQFSDDRQHRLALWRSWDNRLGDAMFIGLNPSTADGTKDDPTIRKCIGFARRWGFGGIHMLNLFTRISTDPSVVEKDLANANHEEANSMLAMYAESSAIVIAAWGRFPFAEARAQEVSALLDDLDCIGTNKDGSPKHPLYVPYSAECVPYLREAVTA